MTVQELEQVIHEYILDIYHEKYIGKMNILKINPIGYKVELSLSTPNKPLVIYAELEDEDFLKFIRNELKAKRFNLINYGQLQLTYPYESDCINKLCKCND